MPYWMKRLSSVHFGETLARELQKLEDGAPDFTLWQETSNLVRLYIPVISVHFITNAAITSTCDAILDEETLFGPFWRDFIKRIPKDQGQSNFYNHPKPKCTCLEESGIQILNLPKTYWFNDIYCGYIIWVSQKDIKDITQGYTGSWGTDFIEIWVIQMSNFLLLEAIQPNFHQPICYICSTWMRGAGPRAFSVNMRTRWDSERPEPSTVFFLPPFAELCWHLLYVHKQYPNYM